MGRAIRDSLRGLLFVFCGTLKERGGEVEHITLGGANCNDRLDTGGRGLVDETTGQDKGG